MGNCSSASSSAVNASSSPSLGEGSHQNTSILVIDDNNAMAKAAAEYIVSLALEKAKGAKTDGSKASVRLAVALAGGSTPKTVYQYLAKNHPQIVSDNLELFFGDVRMVPNDHEDSNYAMVRDSLLFAPSSFQSDDAQSEENRRLVSDEHIHLVDTTKDPVTAARLYEEDIRSYFSSVGENDVSNNLEQGNKAAVFTPAFDLVMLGFGPDGHTASLFPHTKAPLENTLLVTDCMPTPNVKPCVHRVTMTKRLINSAKHIMVLARGDEKRWVLEGVLNGKRSPLAVANRPLSAEISGGETKEADAAEDLPVAAFLRESRSHILFYLDSAASPSKQ